MAINEKKKTSYDKNDSEMVRRFKQNPFLFSGTVVVLVIVIVAFVLVPAIVPESRRGNVDLTFGYYDKVPITYVPGNYFAQYYDMVSRYRQNTQSPENFSYMSYQIWRESFEAAAVHTAILQEMKNAGYAPPKKSVDRTVAGLPQFQENGVFSPSLYRQMDKTRQINLWRQVQDDLAKERFRSDVTGLLKPAAEGEFIGEMAALQRSFSMAVFPIDDYPEAEYEAYIQNHPDLFRSVHLSMLTVNSGEREAQRLLASVKDGETTFEDAARAYSTDGYAEKGGDMGVKMIHELSVDIPEEDIREMVTALARGEYSGVVKTGSGWAFFRTEDPLQDADLSDDTVMDKVRSYVRNFERGRMEDWAAGLAEDFIALAGEQGFEEALSMREMEDNPFGPIPINYGSIDLFTTLSSQTVSQLSGSVYDENFWLTAFSTPVETPSQPIVQGSNVLVLYPVSETEAEEADIENIVSTYNSYWLSYMNDQSMQQYFLNSPKMEDKFFEVYLRYFMPQDQ